jgi:hypothetical protein
MLLTAGTPYHCAVPYIMLQIDGVSSRSVTSTNIVCTCAELSCRWKCLHVHALLSHLQAQIRKPGVPRVREWNHRAVLWRYFEQLHMKVMTHAVSVQYALQCRCVTVHIIRLSLQHHINISLAVAPSNHLGCCGGAVLQYQRQQVEAAALATCTAAHRRRRVPVRYLI